MLAWVTAQSRRVTGVLTATCVMKLDHGVLAGGHGSAVCPHNNMRCDSLLMGGEFWYVSVFSAMLGSSAGLRRYVAAVW